MVMSNTNVYKSHETDTSGGLINADQPANLNEINKSAQQITTQDNHQLSMMRQDLANSDYAEKSGKRPNFTGTVGTGASMGSANNLVSAKYNQ